jgi:hypothetical protein
MSNFKWPSTKEFPMTNVQFVARNCPGGGGVEPVIAVMILGFRGSKLEAKS